MSRISCQRYGLNDAARAGRGVAGMGVLFAWYSVAMSVLGLQNDDRQKA